MRPNALWVKSSVFRKLQKEKTKEDIKRVLELVIRNEVMRKISQTKVLILNPRT